MRTPLCERVVLVVDDERDRFFRLQDLLRQVCDSSYALVWTGSFASARMELLERPFHAALVNHLVGERNGFEFIEQFASQYPACPMILIGEGEDAALDRAAEGAGAAGFLLAGDLTSLRLDRAIRYAGQAAAPRARLRLVLDHAPVGVIALDSSGVPYTWNSEALRALDIDSRRHEGVQASDVAAGLAAIHRAGTLPLQIRNKRDAAFDIGVRIVRGGGQIMAFHDVSGRARAEQTLLLAVGEAEAANQAKSSYLATMSHELRTSLNGLLGMVRALETTPLVGDQVGHIQTLRRSGESLLAIVNDVLDMSKIEAGRLELGDVEFEPRPLIDDIVSLLSANAFAKGIDVAAYVDPLMPSRIRGDPLRLRQVVTNLIGNAVKFTAAGGVAVHVTGPLVEGRRQLRVDVRDTGVGIAGQDLGRLFRKYAQVAQEPEGRDGGTGLGLALCRELVELMGGRIWCDSTLGQGSVFSFSVPLHPLEASVELSARNRALPLQDMTLLVVSRSEAASQVLDAYMRAVGGHTVRVAGESEAIAVLGRDAIDAIIIDALDSCAPGRELIAAMRASPAGARLRSFRLGDGSSRGFDLPLAIDKALSRPIVPRTFAAIGDVLTLRTSACGAARGRQAVVGDGPPEVSGSGRLRVLLAEDNEPNRAVAIALLRQAGYGIGVVGDGEAVVERTIQERFDVVLMDVNMPGVDGIEATRRLRREPRTRHLPVIGVSASATDGDRRRCLDAGMTDHFAKPIDWDRLLGMLGAMERELYDCSPAA